MLNCNVLFFHWLNLILYIITTKCMEKVYVLANICFFSDEKKSVWNWNESSIGKKKPESSELSKCKTGHNVQTNEIRSLWALMGLNQRFLWNLSRSIRSVLIFSYIIEICGLEESHFLFYLLDVSWDCKQYIFTNRVFW